MFTPQSFLEDAVRSSDLTKIRVALSTYLTKNPSNENGEVTQAVEYVEDRYHESLWEEQNDRALQADRSKWTKDYLGYQKSELRNNFSKERFLHVIEVGQVVRKKKTVLLDQHPQVHQQSQEHRWEERISRQKPKYLNRRIAIGVTIGLGMIFLYMLINRE